MKKQFYQVLLLMGLAVFSQPLLAQSANSEYAPVSNGSPSNFKVAGNHQIMSTTPGNSVQALWDIRFNYGFEAASGVPSSAGICFVNNRFIVSKWNAADTVTLFNADGSFISKRRINNAGAIRGMTFDGTSIYAGNNTTAIQVINPSNLTRTRQFTVPASVGNVRWITYNPAGNNGLGSLFVGDFNTAIFEVSIPTGSTAVLLGSIPAATHGLAGMYGMAYEANGANSQFWAHCQNDPASGATSQSVIVQLNAQGVQTGVTRNMQTDAGAAGIAGGIFIGQVPGFTTPTLMALMQGQVVIGYDFAPLAFDAAVDSFNISHRMVAWPKDLNLTPTFGGRVRSVGSTTMSGIAASVSTRNLSNGNLVENLPIDPFGLEPGASKRFITNPINSSLYTTGNFIAHGVAAYSGDQNTSNDTLSGLFSITDSTMSKDYAYIIPALAGRVGIGAAADQEKAIGVKYNTPSSTYITSVSYFLASPAAGQSSSASIYPITDGVIGTAPIATTGEYVATTLDNQNGKLVTLAFPSPVYIQAGDFFVGVNELGDSTLRIGFTGQIFTPNTFYVKWLANAGGAWSDLGNFGANFQRAVSIYPNFGLGFEQPADIPFTVSDTALCAGQTFSVPFTPSGTTYLSGNEFRLQMSDATGAFTTPVTIGSFVGTAAGTINATVPGSMVAGTGYKLRITASRPLRAGASQNAPKIKALPLNPGPISGVSTFCPNDSNKLFAVLPQVGVDQYSWTVPAGSTILSNPDSNAIFVEFGTTAGAITSSGINGCGTGPSSTKNMQLTVVLPASATIFTPSSTVCAGANVSFLSTVQNQGSSPTYKWKKNGEEIIGANSNSYTTNALATGDVITMEVTSSLFCGTPNIGVSNAVTMTVNQPQTPTASITADITGNTACSGTPIIFSSDLNSAGGTSPLLQWFKNNTIITGANQPTYTSNSLVQGDVIKLRYRVTGNCLTATEVFSNDITPTILPVGAVSYTVAGNTLTTVATDVVSYAWYLNGSIIPGATSADYTISESGQYCVEVTFSNSCKNKSECQQQTFVGVNQIVGKGEWSIFPNPTSEIVNIRNLNSFIDQLEVVNSIGQRVYFQSNISGSQSLISLKGLPSGVYHLVGKSVNGSQIKQTLIKK